MAERYGFELIDWETLPDTIKEIKSTEDEPYENVNWNDIIEYFQNRLSDCQTRLVLDNFPPENLVLP